MKAQIVIFNGFDELDAIAPFEILQNAARLGADIQTELVRVGEDPHITAAHGLTVRAHGRMSVDHRPDLLIVPGGNWLNKTAVHGVRTEVQSGAIPTAISTLHGAGTLIAGVCTGAMLIAASGKLTGRRATTHHAALTALAAAGANVIDARVVDDGDIVTSGGVTSGLDLALWLLHRFFGPQTAEQVAMAIEYERQGTVWRRDA